MKILLDENVPNGYKDELIKNGINDIRRINDFGKGLPDKEVFNIAVQEERTIITIDTDFHSFKKDNHYGIISLSGRLNDPIGKTIKALNQVGKDTRFNKDDLSSIFLRITNNNFVVGRKIKSRYKEVTCHYKNKN